MVKKEESKEVLNIEKDLEELISKLDDKETENIVKEFYKSVAKFNSYSFNNIWLLCIRRPHSDSQPINIRTLSRS